ncbi:MAG: hypothetical protein HY422_01470 [Candidatus Komeilibacteria bacterium]|nr:hypothetical protein [Candidatus Komeilibacteria bacterium]
MKVIFSVLIALVLVVGCTDSEKAETSHRDPPPCKPGTYRPSRCFFDYVLGVQIMTAPTCERYASWNEALADPIYKKWLIESPYNPYEKEPYVDYVDVNRLIEGNKTTPYDPKKMPLMFQFLPDLK